MPGFIFGFAGSLLLSRLFFSCSQASRCSGFSCGAWALAHVGSVVVAPRLWSTGSTVVVLGLSCSKACEIFPDQESSLCLLHWQADSLPLSHQGSPVPDFKSSQKLKVHQIREFFL